MPRACSSRKKSASPKRWPTACSCSTARSPNLKGGKTLDGETVFKLYDTYGFPLDLTADIARERGFAIDHAGYEAAMEVQRKQSQAASKFGVDMSGGVRLEDKTDFLGYEATTDVGKVVALLKGGAAVQSLNAGDEGEVVLDRTPFYAESGGQVGDAGELGNVSAKFTVADTQKRGAAHSHIGKLTAGIIKIGDKLAANVDARAPQGHDGQPFGHSSITCSAAQGAGHARAAEGLAGGARPSALRLLAFPGDHARRAARRSNGW